MADKKVFVIENGVLKKYRGTQADVVIPDGITEIGERAFFEYESLISVTIPEGSETIGKEAFYKCKNLTSLSIPDSITEIGARAFHSCASLKYVVIPNGVTKIADYTFFGCSGLTSFNIPDSVTVIENGAFWGCDSLTSVTIPDGVTKIASDAFNRCIHLTSVHIPDSVTTICQRAFQNCIRLPSIKIPESVKEIQNQAFKSCTSLETIFLPNSVNGFGVDIFRSCPNLTVVCGEGSYVHRYCLKEDIHFILDYQYEAFNGLLPQGVEQLSSPFLADEEKPFVFISYSHKDRDTVLNIIKGLYESGWKIWYDEGLTIGDKYDETLEDHVKNCSAFLLFVTKNSLNSLYIEENEVPWAKEYEKPIIKCIVDDDVDFEIDGGFVAATVTPSDIEPALEAISGLTKGEPRTAKGITVFVDSLIRDEENGNQFAYCLYAGSNAAKSKTILHEAKDSGCMLYNAAENGENAEKLKTCACLVVMLDKAFLSDEHLSKILIEEFKAGKDIAVCQLEDDDLPKELKELYSMQWLNYVHGITADMNKKLTRHLEKRRCRDKSALPGFEYEDIICLGIVIKRYTGFDPEPRLDGLFAGSSVAKIGDNAFKNNTVLRAITIPEGVHHICKHAFERCRKLTSVTFSDGLFWIGKEAFKKCTSLTSVDFPKSLIGIQDRAFEECTSLTSVIFKNGITTIGDWAFSNCTSLTSVTLPESITEMGCYIFYNCKSLTSVVLENGLQKIGQLAFYDCPSLKSIVIPDSVTEIGAKAFIDCPSLKSIVIPDSMRKIGDSAFSGCTSLESIVIPDSVTDIGGNVFENCNMLTVICSKGTAARKYCRKHKIPFVSPDKINQKSDNEPIDKKEQNQSEPSRSDFFKRLFGKK